MFIISLGIGDIINVFSLLITHGAHNVIVEITVSNRLLGRYREDSWDYDSEGE